MYGREEIRNNVCHNLKELRIRQDYTQAEVAKATNKAITTVASWEQGLSIPSVATLYVLSRFYNVSVEEICTSLPPLA